MYVKEVILEGFKSYGPRTEVGPFDPHFNAITGLNGSGKSNILDAIIFVLGLNSLGNVRAENLTELVHKGGTVKRCNVSVVLDNQDKRVGRCPLGFDKFKEIVVSRTIEENGQCKYFLNSSASTKKKITDMFESVQLNIQNPTFVIQQGRITKVVNMKPKEILHMVEETVGGNVYQSKRDKTAKELVDKDLYLTSSKAMLNNTILPALAKQRKAAQYLQEYNSLKSEVNAKGQQYAIAAYGAWINDILAIKEKLQNLESNEHKENAQTKEIDASIEEKKKEIQTYKESNTKQVKEKLDTQEKELSKMKKAFDSAKAKFDTASKNEADALQKVKNTEKAFNSECKAVEDFKTTSANLISEFNTIQEEIKNAEKNLSEAKERESDINAGKILGDDGQTIDLRERLIALNDEINNVRPKFDHEVKIAAGESKNLKEKEAELARTQPDDALERDYKNAATEVDRLKKQLTEKQIVPEDFAGFESRFHELRTLKSDLERRKQQVVNSHPNLLFRYTAPYPNFSHEAVHGFLFELFSLKDFETYANPFEVAAGGCLTSVIVDDPQVSRALIEKGRLERRTTFMPMSAIKTYGNIARQADLDRVLGRDKAVACLDLLAYNEKYSTLMRHFFGRLVISKDMASAKTVAFKMGFKCITMEGDVVDPEGLMQGGTRRNIGSFVRTCTKLATVNTDLRNATKEFEETGRKLEYYKRFEGLIKSFQTASRKLENAASVRGLSKYSELQQEVEILKQAVAIFHIHPAEERQQKIKGFDVEIKKLQKEINVLEMKVDFEKDVKAKSLKEVKSQIQKFTKELENVKKKFEAKQKMYNDIDIDIQAKNDLLGSYQQDIDTAKKEHQDAIKDVEAKRELVAQAEEVFKEKAQAVEDIMREFEMHDEQIKQLEEKIKDLKKTKHKFECNKIKRDNDLKILQNRLAVQKNNLEVLKTKHDNVNFADYENLPKPKEPVGELKIALEKAEKRKQEMETKIDMKAASRTEETAFCAKQAATRAVEVDLNRDNISKAIITLDSQKLIIVTDAYDRINKEFGSLMTTLLPESEAKLVKVNPNDLSEGLNIHVRLGGVWKESLTELSGGQRSLVALALVLSLCMFNPAPFYVLDEVDSALDLSHTQNMGVILQSRFKDAQFICVSLKKGMYSNANTLFTVSFDRGLSVVDRSHRAVHNSSAEESESD